MKILSLINKAARKVSLLDLDQSWSTAVQQSAFASWFFSIFTAIADKTRALAGQGELLQQIAFIIVCVLFMLLGLPQFASDKEGLALVSTAGLVVWVLGRLLSGAESRRLNAIDALVLVYLAANIVATFSSHYVAQSLKGLSKVIVYILNYFLLTAVLGKNPSRLTRIIAAALFTGLLVSLYGLYQYKIGVAPLATWEDPTVESKGTRIYSTLGNPNLLAGYLIPLFPLAAALGLASLGGAINGVKQGLQKWILAPLCLSSAAILAVATILTGSRGGYLAVGAMVAAMVMALLGFVLAANRKFILPTLASTLVLLVLSALAVHFLLPSFEQRLASIFAGSEHSSNAYRLYVWRASLQMFQDNWWFGVGPGNSTFRLAYGLYMKSGFDALGTYCVPLEVGVECGVIGLGAFAMMVLSLFARGHLMFWQASQSIYRWLALGLSVALLGLSIQGLVDTVFYRPQVHFIFWLVVAGLAALPAMNEECKKPESLNAAHD